MNRAYRNWLYFIFIPLGFYLLIEVMLGFPYRRIGEEARPHYTETSITLIGVLLFSAIVGLAVNFWHYKRSIHEKRIRKIQMLLSIALLCLDYMLGKIMILGSTMTYDQFVNTIAIRKLDFKQVDRTLSAILLAYFLFQCIFAGYVLMRQRKLEEGH